jgi:hypothetical protein
VYTDHLFLNLGTLTDYVAASSVARANGVDERRFRHVAATGDRVSYDLSGWGPSGR